MQEDAISKDEQKRQAGRELAAISKKLSTLHDKQSVIDAVCSSARELTGADGACVILREGEMVHYSKEDTIAPLWAGQRFPINNCVSGWSILNKAPVVIEDVYNDDRIPIEYYQPTFVKSLAIMPVNHNNPIGAIGVYWSRHRRATDQELESLESLAELMRIAIVNADLFEEASHARLEAERRADELQKQADLIDQSYDALFIWELGGNINSWNRAAEQLYGYTRAEAVGQVSHKILQTIHPRSIQEYEEELRINRAWEGELQHTTKDGRKIIVESRCKVAGQNSRSYVLESNRDITERKLVEELRNRLAGIVESSADAILSKTPDGIITSWNKGAEQLYGYTADEVIGKSVAMLMPAERADDFAQIMGGLIRGERVAHYETIRVSKTGRRIDVLLTVSPIVNSTGKVIGASSIARDITKRKRDEETIKSLLRISEKLNSTLDVETLLDLLVEEATKLVNAEGGVSGLYGPEGMTCHRYFQDGRWSLLEYCWPPGHGLAGRLIQHKAPYFTNDADTDPYILPELREQYRVRSVVSVPVLNAEGELLGFFEIRNKKDPSGFTQSDADQLVSVSQTAAVAIGNALAYREIQRAEEERARLLAREQNLRSQAENANRLKDEFLATISHELRTPLNAIIGWASMLRTGKVDADTTTHALSVVERNAKAQNKIIEDLLDVSRIITGKLRLNVQDADVAAIVRAALDAIRPAADAKGIRLQVVLDPNAGPVAGDPDRLLQVVWNLLANAVKFTPKGGRIHTSLQRINSRIEITVGDTGQGISEDFLPYVFDRFRQSDSTISRTHGGLGLGLALVRHLIEQHGGTVSAQSPGEGQGSTFIVRLPLMIAHDTGRFKMQAGVVQAQQDTYIPFDCPEALEGARLLVVEDERDARDLIRFILEQCNCDVKVAASAGEAITNLETWMPEVLVSDIEMPGVDGYALIRKVRSATVGRGERLPAVALTAHARTEDRMRALSAGYDAHIAKPVEPAELVTVIASLLRRAK